MQKALFLIGFSVALISITKAQSYDFRSPVSASLGLSGASDTTSWALFANPSGISEAGLAVAGIGYHNAYQTKALSARTAFAVIPTDHLNTAIGYVHFGNHLYNMQHFSVNLARPISPHLHLGCRFKYASRYISGSKNHGTFLVDAGLRYVASDNVSVAVMAENPARAVIVDEFSEQPLPSSLAVACMIELSPDFSLTADVVHHAVLLKQVYAFGIVALVHERINVRGAVSAKPVNFAVGSSLKFSGIELNIAASFRDHLGMSTTAGIAYSIGQKWGGAF